jgi:hypothetical protein
MAAQDQPSTRGGAPRPAASTNEAIIASLNKLMADVQDMIKTLGVAEMRPASVDAAATASGGSVGPRSSASEPSAGADVRERSRREQPSSINARRPQYIIAPRQVAGLQPLSADFVVQQLMTSPDISVVKTIQPPRLLEFASADGPAALSSVVVVRVAPKKVEALKTQAPRLIIERNAPLTLTLDPGQPEMRLPNPGVLVPHADGFSVTFEVVGENGPLPEAEIYVFGSVWPTQAVTDASGRVTMSIPGESPDTINALYVKPKLDHWSFWLDRPQLAPDTVNTVTVKPLSGSLREFPGRQLLGWGERAMGLDRVPPSFDGAGIKVAVIDSGAAQTHRNLRKVGPGVSVIGEDRNAWTVDTIGHGSHCAGIIGGGPAGLGSGIRGFAPAAEIHVCRIFPGGRPSDLVAAIDYCIENGIDVINMSLGTGTPSQIIEERIVRAKAMGIACIVAAGNSAGAVQFPASTPHALAVAAIGKWGEFPDDSFHARQALDGFQGRDGYFPAKFSCFGPEVDVCAPGVGIVSSLPADGFGAWDGTSMAAPHVTGLAALVLAHHPDFRGQYRNRDAQRVERLFEVLKSTAIPLQFGDEQRTGAGLPNAARALGLDGAGAAAATPGAVPEASMMALRRLLAELARGSSMAGRPAPFAASAEPTMAMASTFSEAVARGPARTTGGLEGSWLSGALSSLSR